MRAAVQRLKRRSEFLRVAAAKRKWAAPGLVLQVARRPASGTAAPPPNEGPVLGLGFTVSRKVGNAVQRNRARRRLRAAAQALFPEHAAPGSDYVLIGRRETLDRPYALLLQDLQLALKRLGVYRDDNAVGHVPERR